MLWGEPLGSVPQRSPVRKMGLFLGMGDAGMQ